MTIDQRRRLRAGSSVAALSVLVLTASACQSSQSDSLLQSETEPVVAESVSELAETTSGESGDASAADFPAEIRDAGAITIGMTVPQPPFTLFEDQESDELAGIDVDLARALGELTGLDIEFRRMDFSALIPALESGQVDILWSGLLPSEDRLAVADFIVYLRNPYGILVPEGNPKGIREVADLCGHKVGLVQGSTPPRLIVEDRQPRCEAEGKPPIETGLYPDQDTVFLAIRSGEVDAYVGAGAAAGYVAASTEGGEVFDAEIDDEGLGGTVYFPDGVAVEKGKDELLEAVQGAMQRLIDSDEYVDILADYGADQFAVTEASINGLSDTDQ